MRTMFNPQTGATYELGEDGNIVGTVGDRFNNCKECQASADNIVQRGPYKELCQRCRRKKYYIDNKEKENANCRRYYEIVSGKEKMIERRYGGNYKKCLKRDGNKCTTCGSTRDLVVHHKDKTGMKSAGSYKKSNNSMGNLITLCRGCHSRLHNSNRK